MSLSDYLADGAALLEKTRESRVVSSTEKAIDATVAALQKGTALLTCGNGGSAADSMHITGELVGHFLKERKPYRCISLASDPVVLTAIANDYSYEDVFKRQVVAHGEKGGVLIGLSTSGNSKNVIEAFMKAKEMGMTTVAFTGEGGGKLAEYTDILIDVPSTSTPDIQQVHQSLYHYFCAEVERKLS